ncbi:MAG: universal stress protein [Acidimicrobiales bacterium]|jgi:nucleotide-binding universal stress UspA family protein
MYKSVLVATDGSATASEAVRAAIELAQVFGATLHIASVYNTADTSAMAWSGMTIPYVEGEDPGGDAAAHTEAMAAGARSKGISVETHVMPGYVVEQILGVAVKQKVELIVVGNKGMKGLKRVLGSVPNAIAHSAPCAVLIVNTT